MKFFLSSDTNINICFILFPIFCVIIMFSVLQACIINAANNFGLILDSNLTNIINDTDV